MKTIFLRALERDDKAQALLDAIHAPNTHRGTDRFELDSASFALLPRSPFSYWVSEQLRALFKDLPPFEGGGRTAKVGLGTSDDFRFLRAWWEVPACNLRKRWCSFAKGGSTSPFYSAFPLVVNWERGKPDGHEIKAFLETTPGTSHWSRRAASSDLYFAPGLTWPLRAARFSPYALPAGSVFSVRGYSAFVPKNDLALTLAVFNSRIFDYLFKTTLGRYGFPEFVVGKLQILPWNTTPSESCAIELSELAGRAWRIKRHLDTRTENSHAFTLPALLQTNGETLVSRADAWSESVTGIQSDLAAIQAQIDVRCFELYGINENDRRIISEGFGAGLAEEAEPEIEPNSGADSDGESDEESDFIADANAASLAAEMVSWTVGVAFGRFDVRIATGSRSLPTDPGPFDPLPICSPAMLADHEDRPATSVPAGYPLVFPENGTLVDDRGHMGDLTLAVRSVFEEVFKADVDAWWDQVSGVLGSKDRDLRSWLTSSFFEHHLRCHSKSRRKAPIIWQLAVPSGRYSVWLYAPKLTHDTFFKIRNDVVIPKLAHEERQLTQLIQAAGATPSAKERKEIAEQAAMVGELRSFLDEIKHVAPLWKPNLDDGVVLTMAPLWRLVPQHKVWQKELKSKWDQLAGGKYDWSHLAMHLWPARVVLKCMSDRSLAIVHGLESIFWTQGEDGKWIQRLIPMRPVDELVRERTSAAVGAALKELTEASAPNGQKATPRRSSS
jgi:hypothetical protein